MKHYKVWDRTVRWFHWINVLCITGLITFGLLLLNDDAFGFGKDGKILLKTIHAYIGYVFVINLAVRLVWGFVGGPYSRWKRVLPFYKGYLKETGDYLKQGNFYKGHNPVARLIVSLLFLLMITQATTGLVLAGTDLYLPPFGHEIAEWITGDTEDHKKIKDLTPKNKTNVDKKLYKEMRAFRKPYISLHVTVFYILAGLIIFHILGVIVTELRERNGIISAMFTGEKVSDKEPVDDLPDK